MGVRTGNPTWVDGIGTTLITAARLNALEAALDASLTTALMRLGSTPTWRLPMSQANGTAAYLTGSLYLAPIPVLAPCHADGLSALCTTAGGAGALTSLALYDDTGAFAPGALLASSVGLDTSTTGMKGGTFTSIPLTSGIYWAGLLPTVGTGQNFEKISTVSGGSDAETFWPWLVMPAGTGALSNAGAGNDGSVAIQTGLSSLPSTFAGTLQGDSNSPKIPPAIWLRLAT